MARGVLYFHHRVCTWQRYEKKQVPGLIRGAYSAHRFESMKKTAFRIKSYISNKILHFSHKQEKLAPGSITNRSGT